MNAYLYEKLSGDNVKCNLCNHRCVIKDGKRGICNVRENQAGVLKTLVYDRLIAMHIDPIEKKPLFHFLPTSQSYSIAAVGCNFKCLFCQNADIAQMPSDRNGMIAGSFFAPEDIVNDAIKNKCLSISYTYTEPTVYFELAFDTAKLASEKGVKNVFVTNGYMTSEALHKISPYLDAANVDLKSFSEDFYSKYCGAKLSHVKETLKLMKKLGIFVEVTTLLIPELNDDDAELEQSAKFIAEELGRETPWHISAFHPVYKLTDRPPTPIESLVRAREIGIKLGLKYVYIGNISGQDGENTFCHNCGKTLIRRWGFSVEKNMIKNGKCSYCGSNIEGIWEL